MSLITRVHNSGNLFQAVIYLSQDLAAVRITAVSVTARCLQGESFDCSLHCVPAINLAKPKAIRLWVNHAF